jgi:hypothetical protein
MHLRVLQAMSDWNVGVLAVARATNEKISTAARATFHGPPASMTK